MTQITGDITRFFDALGRPEDDAAVAAAIEAFGSTFTVEEFDLGSHQSRHLVFNEGGGHIAFQEGVVYAISLYLEPQGEYRAYSSPDTLIDGVSAGATRSQVAAALGEPRSTAEASYLYAVDGAFLNTTFAGDELSFLMLMKNDPLVPASTDTEIPDDLKVRPGAEIPRPSGDIARFLTAVGTAQTDEDLAKLMLLTGPGMEHEKVQRDGVEWLYVFLTGGGVDLQFKDGVLVAALIHVARSTGSTFRRAARLIVGLPLPAHREQVRDALGEPAVTSSTAEPGSSFDLYNLEGGALALSLDYRDDEVVSVTVLQRGVSAES